MKVRKETCISTAEIGKTVIDDRYLRQGTTRKLQKLLQTIILIGFVKSFIVLWRQRDQNTRTTWKWKENIIPHSTLHRWRTEVVQDSSHCSWQMHSSAWTSSHLPCQDRRCQSPWIPLPCSPWWAGLSSASFSSAISQHCHRSSGVRAAPLVINWTTCYYLFISRNHGNVEFDNHLEWGRVYNSRVKSISIRRKIQ